MDDNQRLQRLVEQAREFSPRGFAAFYWIVTSGTKFPSAALPKHARHWIDTLFEAKEDDKGLVCFAFRGSTKTTTFDTFVAWFTGHKPTGSSLMIRGEEKQAKLSAAYAAGLIADNSAWKAVFPHIVPDTNRAWSVESGYEVMDTRYSYDEWRRMNAGRHDPSILSAPYNSKGLQGKHPSNILLVDDILTPQNTTSEREHERVVNIVTSVLDYAVVDSTWRIFIGTPWFDHDVYHRMAESSEYVLVRTPALDEQGEAVWPQIWAKEKVEAKRAGDLTGGAEFARMMLLDVSPKDARRFRFQQIDAGLINPAWPMYGGVDYASVPMFGEISRHRSHYALAYVAQVPAGGAVIHDGVLTQWTRDEGVMAVLRAQDIFEDWRHTGVEADGKGEEFIADLMMHPNLKFQPVKTKNVRKEDRLEKYLGPLFNTGRLRLSNASTPFLDTVRRFLNQYPNVVKSDSGWDALDSIYCAVLQIPNMVPAEEFTQSAWMFEKKKRKLSPYAMIGKG